MSGAPQIVMASVAIPSRLKYFMVVICHPLANQNR
jgi:hypothetical protein